MNRPAAGGSVRRRYKKRLPGGGRPGVIFRRFFQPVFTDASLFRRFRDYSTVAMIGFYLLQVIDANVFAYMQDFEVNDDLSMRVTPTVITPYTNYAMNTGRDGAGFRMPSAAPGAEALGMRIGFTF